MKPEQIYIELKNLSEKLNIIISEQSFRKTGIKVRSGFCRIKGKNYFIVDRDLSTPKKNELIAEYFSNLNYENIYIVPAVRDFINLNKSSKKGIVVLSETEKAQNTV
ncbi:MAG: hypothetical protein R6V76_11675 [Desulfobacterales bacterium]